MTRRAYVHRIAARAPDDVSALDAGISAGEIDPRAIVAIVGKTEGNGCVNDFTRSLASRALKDALKPYQHADSDQIVSIVMSGGTEGGLAPHFIIFEAREVDEPAEPKALAIGRARTSHLSYEKIGRLAQVNSVAQGVRAAMRDAGIISAADVHFVQIKCPLLTADRIAEAETGGAQVATRDTLKSMGLSRAASALGVAVALNETDQTLLTEQSIGQDWSIYSSRASASAGVELTDHEIIVLGVAQGWSGPLRIEHCVMQDAIDIEPVRASLARLGLKTSGQLPAQDRARMIALLAKAEASSSGSIRGHRHTMLNDSDISSTRHARAFVGGALASLVGHGEIYVSGGAEHQGPDGGGPVAIIASCDPRYKGVYA